VPPANEKELWEEILWVMNSSPLRMQGPRHTLCEYWRQREDLLVCCANLHPQADGGPMTLHLPGQEDGPAQVFRLYENSIQNVMIRGSLLTIDSIPRFVAVRIPHILRGFSADRRLAVKSSESSACQRQ